MVKAFRGHTIWYLYLLAELVFFFWQVMNFMQTQEWGLMILDGECSTFLVPKTSIHWNPKKRHALIIHVYRFLDGFVSSCFGLMTFTRKPSTLKMHFQSSVVNQNLAAGLWRIPKELLSETSNSTCKIPKAPEDVSNQVVIDFSLASDWLRGWRKCRLLPNSNRQ